MLAHAMRKTIAQEARKRVAPALAGSLRTLTSTSGESRPIGFIGLGNMGGHMAHNLMKHGNDLIVFDVAQASVDRVKDWGAALNKKVYKGETPADVASAASVVITMLPSSPHVKEVYAGDKGIFSTFTTANKPELLLDSSTIAPPVAQEVAALCSKLSNNTVAMLDCPVSGGVGGAEAGTLTFMVGGDQANFERAVRYLKMMGKNIVHCGGPGTGQIAKVCNNLILAISMTGVAEAMNLGVTLGIDPKVLAGIVNTSSGRCWSSDTYNPVPGVMPNVPASKGYVGGFGVDLMLKDIRLALEAAESVGVKLPAGNTAASTYADISKAGAGRKDFAYVYEYLKNLNSK